MSSVITIDDESQIAYIQMRLGALNDQAPKVLARAINDTAKQARKKLVDKAQETYVVKTGRFNKAMTIKTANQNRLAATITTKGAPMELHDFKVSPSGRPSSSNLPDTVKGKVVAANSLKSLQKGNIKAFITAFASGHITVAQRTGPSRLPIKTLMSVSIPQMIGSEAHVYGILQPEIAETLQRNDDAEIEKMIKKEGS